MPSQRLCLRINQAGQGVIGISAYLSPNSLLLNGQGNTIDRFQDLMSEWLPQRLHLRKNDYHWPPLHTPIMWQRAIPNRCAVMMHTLPGALQTPVAAGLSLVTGKTSYNDLNCRELMAQWIDHPQRLWDAVYETLGARDRSVVHVGPDAEPRSGHVHATGRKRQIAACHALMDRHGPAGRLAGRSPPLARQALAAAQRPAASPARRAGRAGGLAVEPEVAIEGALMPIRSNQQRVLRLALRIDVE